MPGGDLEAVMWDVKHGLSIFMNLPNDRTVMVDAGASEDFSPVSWLRDTYQLQQLDGLIITHQHADHVREIGRVHKELKPRVLRRNKNIPPNVLYPNGPPTTDPMKSYDEMDRSYIHPVGPELRLDNPANWGGVQFRFFQSGAPAQQFTNVNDYSLATVVDYGPLKLIIPGDLENAGWDALMAREDFRTACISNASQIRVLVASHHGHTRGIHQPFLSHYKPAVTIISAVHGDEHTDADAYRGASSGWRLFDSSLQQWRECKVVTTKTNDYVFIRVDSQSGDLVIGI